MTKLEQLRDEMAESHNHTIVGSFYAGGTDRSAIRLAYKEGFNTSTAHWQKLVEPLVDALRLYASHYGNCDSIFKNRLNIYSDRECDCGGRTAFEALEQYRKDIE